MLERPSKIWKDMPTDVRVKAADAFWRDTNSPEIGMQHIEATVALARRLNFRTRSVQALAIERRAKALAQMSDISDAIATRVLIAYHFQHQRPLMSAFLDALAVQHDGGMITADDLPPPPKDRIRQAVESVSGSFAADELALYLRTLVALDADTWVNLTDEIPTVH